VDSVLQEEYDELLKFAVVIPSYPALTSFGPGRSLGGGDYRLQPTTLLQTDVAGRQVLPPTSDHISAPMASMSVANQKVEPERKTSTASLKSKAKADVAATSLPTSHGILICTG